ncbi:MAG: hypothetical protein JW834_03925 [Candidatus Diapherotrites archaeon]|nr:hypothetical protein [Candidatus Diapherotrites archaeon]
MKAGEVMLFILVAASASHAATAEIHDWEGYEFRFTGDIGPYWRWAAPGGTIVRSVCVTTWDSSGDLGFNICENNEDVDACSPVAWGEGGRGDSTVCSTRPALKRDSGLMKGRLHAGCVGWCTLNYYATIDYYTDTIPPNTTDTAPNTTMQLGGNATILEWDDQCAPERITTYYCVDHDGSCNPSTHIDNGENVTFWESGALVLSYTSTDEAGNMQVARKNVTINFIPEINASIPRPVFTGKATCEFNASDADEHNVSVTINWFMNNNATNETSSEFTNHSKHDNITCEVTAYDGYNSVTRNASATVMNSPPSVHASITGDDELACEFSATDADEENVTTNVSWTKNNEGFYRNQTIPASDTNPGDNFSCTVTAWDGEEASKASANTTIHAVCGNNVLEPGEECDGGSDCQACRITPPPSPPAGNPSGGGGSGGSGGVTGKPLEFEALWFDFPEHGVSIERSFGYIISNAAGTVFTRTVDIIRFSQEKSVVAINVPLPAGFEACDVNTTGGKAVMDGGEIAMEFTDTSDQKEEVQCLVRKERSFYEMERLMRALPAPSVSSEDYRIEAAEAETVAVEKEWPAKNETPKKPVEPLPEPPTIKATARVVQEGFPIWKAALLLMALLALAFIIGRSVNAVRQKKRLNAARAGSGACATHGSPLLPMPR